jgi:hypothetical protein
MNGVLTTFTVKRVTRAAKKYLKPYPPKLSCCILYFLFYFLCGRMCLFIIISRYYCCRLFLGTDVTTTITKDETSANATPATNTCKHMPNYIYKRQPRETCTQPGLIIFARE